MRIRPYEAEDFEELLALTVATFRPFFEESFPAIMGHDEHLVSVQHGRWREDYRAQLTELHEPEQGRHVSVAVEAGAIVGYVARRPGPRPGKGEIEILAVAEHARGRGIGRALMEHALAALREAGYTAVELGTGGDPFHAPARALYESLGFRPIPVVAYLKRL